MSTRSVITVKDNNDTFHVYRHCYGYPRGEHGVLATLAQALPFAWPLPRFEASDFAAAIVRAWKQPGGGNVYFTESFKVHGDLAYRYEVRQRPDHTLEVRTFQPSEVDGWEELSRTVLGAAP